MVVANITTATIVEGIDFTPHFTISTLQFQSEALNTIATSLLTTLLIANLGSIINRLVFLTHRDYFSYSSFARSFVFLNSDDPLRLWFWIRGRYDFRANNRPPAHHRMCKRYVITPLCARMAILFVSIGSIALALPSEKRLNACSRGDYTIIQSELSAQPNVSPQELLRVCSQIPLKTDLGTVRSTASYCSFMTTPGDIPSLTNLASLMENLTTMGVIGAGYFKESGLLLSIIVSGDRIQAISSFVEWKTENNDLYHSVLPYWNSERHLKSITDGLTQALEKECNVLSTSLEDMGDDSLLVGLVDCTFDANFAIRYVSASVRESLRFQKKERLALRTLAKGDSISEARRICAVDISVSRPLLNIVPLFVGVVIAFCLNLAVVVSVSRHGNAMDAAFHLVREVLGHDTGANPLQISARKKEEGSIPLRKFVCADGVSAHIGFVQGLGDVVVEEFSSGRTVGRCMQVACQGPRFVRKMPEKGNVTVI
ncbi:unnamed protein product [Agarophyton chilense]|eukprot:gb/GEZJ01003468.1/.p1 GENE.gb/GEZJ01003468.1/~~gb/GEZJ01003468.1/.p1  ORF type:complete len:485 (-),score=49.94 gb/GEZJ01003468.1/:77-1531(-)